MMYLIGACVAVALIVIVGGQMNRQASAHGPRKGTQHLAKIRKKARGGSRRRRGQ